MTSTDLSPQTLTTNYRKVIAEAIGDALEADPRVVFFGEDVAAAGGAFKTTVGLFERFGPDRVKDTPIAEQAIVGAAIGLAMLGSRPIAEIMFADFAAVCFDQIVNQLAKYRYMTAGQVSLPVTIRMANGAGAGFAAQHSQAAENWFLNVPGLMIAVPATVQDLYGVLRTAVDVDDPVIVFEHKNLFDQKGTVTRGHRVPVGDAAIVRAGRDITIVATQQMLHRTIEAAEILAGQGVEAEVIDPRWLVPFDYDTLTSSLIRTSKLLLVQESPESGSWASTVAARVASRSFELLDGPPMIISSPATPVPYAGNLEAEWIPSVPKIVAAATKLARY